MANTARDQDGTKGSRGARNDFDVRAVKEAKSFSATGLVIGGAIAAVLLLIGMSAETPQEDAADEPMAAEEPMATEADAMAAAGDAMAADEMAEADVVVLPTAPVGTIFFGDDSSAYSNDGECDDPRFGGPGMASSLLDENSYHDATDCRVAYNRGTISME